jgi:hypothetical protein
MVTQDDLNWLDGTVIPRVCDYIDSLAGTTWGVRLAQGEIYTIGKPSAYSMYLVGSPIYLQHHPIIPAYYGYSIAGTVTQGWGAINSSVMIAQSGYMNGASVVPATVNPSAMNSSLWNFGVWNGSYYEMWVQNGVNLVTESRNGMFWTDTMTGIIYVIGWFFYMGYEVVVDYFYGYNTAGTPYLDGQVKWLAILLSAKYFLDSERYNSIVSQGIGGIEMTQQWDYLNKRIAELESYVAGFRTLSGGFI